MRIDRFYLPPTLHNKNGAIELKHDFWLQDPLLIHQWSRVLRYQPGQQLILYDGLQTDRLYEISEINDLEAHLNLVTEYERNVPQKIVYLFFSVLKKDKNDWVLQKCTELGVSHFIPILAERSEKINIDLARAHRITIEASEQCGRSDIPSIREPILLKTALQEFVGRMKLFVCEQGGEKAHIIDLQEMGLFIGPEGGWSDREMKLFGSQHVTHLKLGDYILRAETACVIAAGKLLQ